MTILDSGTRREFKTGAVRDVNEDKGRCDLLPLVQIGRLLDSKTLTSIGMYVETGNTSYIYDVIRLFIETYYPDTSTAMIELSKHYAEGCRKYGARNWQKGIDLHCYIDSGIRHWLKVRRGDTDEDHKRAFLWNMAGLLWTHENMPDLIDLPFRDVDERETRE